MESHFLRIDKASPNDLDSIILFVEETAKKLEADSSIASDFVLATMEAVTNVLTHGYKGQPGLVEIEVRKNGNSLVIVFRDFAETFDPTQIPPPDTALPMDQRPVGGLGVHLIKNFVDELIHQVPPQGGNELICIKKDIFP
jgi:serine/threonine-protein kinase RsbW